MREFNIILGITLGILASLGVILGLALFSLGNGYGEKLGGMAFIVTITAIWGIPALYCSVIKPQDTEVDLTTIQFCRWINRIFVAICLIGITTITL